MGRRAEAPRRTLSGDAGEVGELGALAARLRACREEEDLTLHQLAERSGVAPSTIQKVEKGAMTPTISILMKIVRGLRRPLSHFIGDEGPAEVAVVRASKRAVAFGRRGDVVVERLAGEIRDAVFDVYEATLPPGKGTVVFTVGGEAHRLRPGDSIHFASTIPHAYENPDRRREARVLLVGSVPRGRIVP
jgi:transcriptional regulator with XRE-family HTH domain